MDLPCIDDYLAYPLRMFVRARNAWAGITIKQKYRKEYILYDIYFILNVKWIQYIA